MSESSPNPLQSSESPAEDSSCRNTAVSPLPSCLTLHAGVWGSLLLLAGLYLWIRHPAWPPVALLFALGLLLLADLVVTLIRRLAIKTSPSVQSMIHLFSNMQRLLIVLAGVVLVRFLAPNHFSDFLYCTIAGYLVYLTAEILISLKQSE